MKTCIAVLAFFLLHFSSAQTAITPEFTYEGALKTPQGFQVEAGTYDIVLRVYDAAAGGNKLWCGATTIRTDSDGRFSVIVGDATCTPVPDESATCASLLDALLAEGVTRWFIGVSISGGEEIAPRQEIVCVPIANRAITVPTVRGDLTGEKFHAEELVVRGGLTAECPVETTGTLEGDSAAKGEFLSGLEITQGDLTVHGSLTLTGGTLSAPVVEGAGTVPKGLIVALAPGYSVPDGWALCDGQDGRPNLCGRFIYGCESDSYIGKTDGEAMHKLTEDEVPSHYHSVDYNIATDTGRGYAGSSDSDDDDQAWADLGNPGNKDFNSDYWGDGNPHENRPPYFALKYIIKL